MIRQTSNQPDIFVEYIGIDGCKAGWFLVGLGVDGSADFQVLNGIGDLTQYINTAEIILIDIPIGLRGQHPDERGCDKQARKALQPGRGSSVFPAPSRCALECTSYEEANRRNRACTGRGMTKQTFNILPRIREVDEFLRREERRDHVHEMHPEVCFWALNNGQPMAFNKKTTEGYAERVALLEKYYPGSRRIIEKGLQQYQRAEVARDDIVDALVGAVTARNSASWQRFPEKPEIDAEGLPMEIVYWAP